MITFKQFLLEADQQHDSVEEVATEFLQHCSEWKNVTKPLYRITNHRELAPSIRTRETAKRKKASRAGTRDEQRLIFSQAGWASFPDRTKSVFCGTTEQIEVGSVNFNRSNLVVIYPYDGVKLAVTEGRDFNRMPIVQYGNFEVETGGLKYWISLMYENIYGYSAEQSTPWRQQIKMLKKLFSDKSGNFSIEKLSKELKEEYEKASEKTKLGYQALIEQDFPNNLTPEKLGVSLQTAATIQLPGNPREVWFEGKYISIPAPEFKDFVKQVKLQKKSK